MRRLRRGFTLVELVLVVAIAAVAATIALPRLTQQTKPTLVVSEAMKLASTLETQRDRARELGLSQQVRFARTGYVVVERDAGDKRARLVSFHDRVRLMGVGFGTSADVGVCFDASGTPCMGGSVLLASGSFGVRLDLEAVTGVVTFSVPTLSMVSKPTASDAKPRVMDVSAVTVPATLRDTRLSDESSVLSVVTTAPEADGIVAHAH
jgi:prepilin-type N-terminal cleavage/methylation domain-containing protein